MIKYFPKAQVLTTVVAFVVLTLLLGLIYFFAPQEFIWYLLGPVVCIMLATMVSWNVGSYITNKEANKVFKVLLDDCSPREFLELSDPIVERIKDPKGVWEASLLSCRSLALLDVGKRFEAEKAYHEFSDVSDSVLKPVSKGRIAMYAYAPALDLYGYQGAQRCLDSARSYLDTELDARSLPGFQDWVTKQQEFVNTLRDYDCEKTIDLMKEAYSKSSFAMFNRIRNARTGAQAAKACGDIYSEIEFLGFIIHNGNKLHAVIDARTRLLELKDISRKSTT